MGRWDREARGVKSAKFWGPKGCGGPSKVAWDWGGVMSWVCGGDMPLKAGWFACIAPVSAVVGQ